MECSICLSEINNDDATSKTICGHTFHSECIFKSIAHKNFSCPNCRKKLVHFANTIEKDEEAFNEIMRSITVQNSIPTALHRENERLFRRPSLLYSRTIIEDLPFQSPQFPRIITNEESISLLNRNLATYSPRQNLRRNLISQTLQLI